MKQILNKDTLKKHYEAQDSDVVTATDTQLIVEGKATLGFLNISNSLILSDEEYLPIRKEQLKKQVSDLSKAKRDGGIVFNGLKVSTDDKARSLLNGALADAQGNIKFVTSSGRAVLTQAEFSVLYNAVQVHIRDCFANEYDLTEALDLATTDADLSSIDISAGWPQ